MAKAYLYSLTDTWNSAGTTFTGIGLNVTDTASAAGSALIDLQVGGVSQFKVSKAGAVTAVGVAIPTISSIDTLSNKTLSSPTISGTVAGSPTFNGVTTFARGTNHEVVVLNQTDPATYNLDVQWQDNGSVRWLQSVRVNSNDDFWFYNIGRGSVDIGISASTGIVTFGNGIAIADAKNIALDTTTGTKIGTATSQKLGFFNATPVVQPTAVADATGAGDVVAQLNALLTRMRNLGLIAT